MKESIVFILLLLLMLAFLLNYPILSTLYPDAEQGCGQFLKFYNMRNKVYETMFFISFLLLFLNTTGINKVLATFAMVLAFGSFIDKVFFNITEYLITDVALIILAALVSYLIIKKEFS